MVPRGGIEPPTLRFSVPECVVSCVVACCIESCMLGKLSVKGSLHSLVFIPLGIKNRHQPMCENIHGYHSTVNHCNGIISLVNLSWELRKMATTIQRKPTANLDSEGRILCPDCGRLFGWHDPLSGSASLEPHYGERESGFYRRRKRMPRRPMYDASGVGDVPVTRVEQLPARAACRHCGTISIIQEPPV